MPPTNRHRLFRRLLVGAILILVAVWIGLGEWAARIRTRHNLDLEARQLKFGAEDALRLREAKRRRAAGERSRLELVRLLGGPVESAVRDPTLTLRQMIERLATACSPTGTVVSVRVDRFTEFEVALELREPPTLPQLAQIAQCLLRHATPAIHDLRFLFQREYVAGLPWSAIESVPDWNLIASDQIAALFNLGDDAGEPSLASAAPSPSAATNNLAEPSDPVQARVKEAYQVFDQHGREQLALIIEVSAELDRDGQFATARAATELQERINGLENSKATLAAARRYFSERSADLGQLLLQQGVDPLAIQVMRRDLETRLGKETPVLLAVCDALEVHRQQTQTLLRTMFEHWVFWSVNPADPQRIQFTRAATKAAYSTASDNCVRSSMALQTALKAWQAHSGAR